MKYIKSLKKHMMAWRLWAIKEEEEEEEVLSLLLVL